jgi:two-component system, cell cycle response regulator
MSEKVSILIVDDEADSRDTLAELLAEKGYDVQGAASGSAALDMIESGTYDLVITDLIMPRVDGIALTKNIRSQNLDMPIIVVTGFATIEYAVESMKAGAFDFITKPFNFEQIAFTIEKALETKRLRQLASESEFYRQLSHSDELTQLANYRAFYETFQREIERAQRYNHSLALLMIDIDDFKKCNDTYGHLSGDEVLKQMADLIRQNTRGSDFVARYGGEEFFAVLPETDEPEALAVAERIRSEIERYVFLDENRNAIEHLSVTVGISSLPLRATNKRDLIRTADFALYRGKSAGKNRVVLFEE